jgi:hypothetical protein
MGIQSKEIDHLLAYRISRQYYFRFHWMQPSTLMEKRDGLFGGFN